MIPTSHDFIHGLPGLVVVIAFLTLLGSLL